MLTNAVIARSHGTPDVLEMVELLLPSLAPFEVLIKTYAAGINRPDILQREGIYPAPKYATEVLGLELAGVVIETGSAVTRWKVGDEVMALVNGGAYALHSIAHEDLCFSKPKNYTWAEAACLPEGIFTIWHNVFERGNLQKNETLLIHGGNSGIGSLAIQMGKTYGAKVIVTCRDNIKCKKSIQIGADFAIDSSCHNFANLVKSYTNNCGANVILDMVGGDFIQMNYEAAAQEGKIVNIAFQSGSKIQIDMNRIMLKRLTHTGSTLRSRSIEDKIKIAHAIRNIALEWAHLGNIKPIIHEIFKFSDATKAHEKLETGTVFGKIVLDMYY